MTNLDHIAAPVKSLFDRFDALLGEVTHSSQPFIGPITRDILHGGGKRMRPLLTLLAARLGSGAELEGDRAERVMAAAVLTEMIHWSTLVHDDVIDEAYMRRGEWTPGALLRSKSAVLVGDYLFSKGLAYASRKGSFAAISHSTLAIELVVDGELLQMEHSRLMDTTREIYTEIIRHKTAALIASAAASGAAEGVFERDSERAFEGNMSQMGSHVAHHPHRQTPQHKAHIERMYLFGELLGLAFQIKDDLLDYGFGSDGSIGKALCNDLREGKLTLPLIRAISVVSATEARTARRHLRHAADSTRSVDWLRAFVEASDGVAYTEAVMNDYHARAVALLHDNYPSDPTVTALEAYADYVIGRGK